MSHMLDLMSLNKENTMNYATPPPSWYDPADEAPEMMALDDHETVMTDLRDHFLGIIEELYGCHDISVKSLDNCVQEICHILELHSPSHGPNVQRYFEPQEIEFLESDNLIQLLTGSGVS